MGYNAIDELTSAVLKTDATNATVRQFYYGYDKAANRTSKLEDMLPPAGLACVRLRNAVTCFYERD